MAPDSLRVECAAAGPISMTSVPAGATAAAAAAAPGPLSHGDVSLLHAAAAAAGVTNRRIDGSEHATAANVATPTAPIESDARSASGQLPPTHPGAVIDRATALRQPSKQPALARQIAAEQDLQQNSREFHEAAHGNDGSREKAAAQLGLPAWRGGAIPLSLGMAIRTPFLSDDASYSTVGHSRAAQSTSEDSRAAPGSEVHEVGGGASSDGDVRPSRQDVKADRQEGRRYTRQQMLDAMRHVVDPFQLRRGFQLDAKAEGTLQDLSLLLPPQPLASPPLPTEPYIPGVIVAAATAENSQHDV